MTTSSSGTDAPALRRIFVIGPIDKPDANGVDSCKICLEEIIRPAAKAAGGYAVPQRIDDDTKPGMITKRIVTSILEADVCIADLTTKNANVMYEVAIAHAANKPVILLQEPPLSVPFDFGAEQAIPYGIRADEAHIARDLLADALRSAFAPEGEEFGDTFNPVRDLFARLRTETAAAPSEQATWERLDELQSMLTDMGRTLRGLTASLPTHAASPPDTIFDQNPSPDPLRTELLMTGQVPPFLAGRITRAITTLVDQGALPSNFPMAFTEVLARAGSLHDSDVELLREASSTRTSQPVAAASFLQIFRQLTDWPDPSAMSSRHRED